MLRGRPELGTAYEAGFAVSVHAYYIPSGTFCAEAAPKKRLIIGQVGKRGLALEGNGVGPAVRRDTARTLASGQATRVNVAR